MTKPENLAELRKQWRDDPEFNAEYAALNDEFAVSESAIKAESTPEPNSENCFDRGSHGQTTRH
jgi:hypothetical protein